jgi:hypothetical protein
VTVLDVTGQLRTARRWSLAIRASQILAIALSAYFFGSSDEMTISGPLPGSDPDTGALVAIAWGVGVLLVLPLTWFAARGSRVAMLASSLLLLAASVIALLHAIGNPFEAPLRGSKPTETSCMDCLDFASFRDVAAFVRTASSANSLSVWALVGVLCGGILFSIGLTFVSLIVSIIGVVAAFRPPPRRARDGVRIASRLALTARGSAAFLGSILLWFPTVGVTLLAGIFLGAAVVPLMSVKHDGETTLMWWALEGGLSLSRLLVAFGSTISDVLVRSAILLVLDVVALLVISFAARLTWVIGRRFSQRDALRLREHDTRPPLFLIRSFKDQSIAVRGRLDWRFLVGRINTRTSLEQVVVNSLWRFGPVLTIGTPGDRLAPLGAAREYVSDERWRERVREYLESSRVVVIMLGDTDNLAWECERVAAFGLADRVLAVMPPVNDAGIAARWSRFRRNFPPATMAEFPQLPLEQYPLVMALSENGPACVVACRWRTRDAYEAALEVACQFIPAFREAATPTVV